MPKIDVSRRGESRILRIDRYKTAAKSLMEEMGRGIIDSDEER